MKTKSLEFELFTQEQYTHLYSEQLSFKLNNFKERSEIER